MILDAALRSRMFSDQGPSQPALGNARLLEPPAVEPPSNLDADLPSLVTDACVAWRRSLRNLHCTP